MPASDADSPAPASRPDHQPPPFPTHAEPPSAYATCEACPDSRQAPRKACRCACMSGLAQRPSLGTTPDASPIPSSPFAVPPSLQLRSFSLVSLLGVTPPLNARYLHQK